MKGFRQFITRGNLIDLAVAVVIGTAFTAVVTAARGLTLMVAIRVWARTGAWPSRAQTS